VTIIIVLLLCMWMLYRLFIGIPPAPPPEVKQAAVSLRTAAAAAALVA
jgi:hypothetical protein